MGDSFMRMYSIVVRLKLQKKIQNVRLLKKNKVRKENAGINCDKINYL